MNISLIIPTLNEGGNIKILLNQIATVFKNSPEVENAEIIIVDDGSTDETTTVAKNTPLPYPVQVIKRTVRGLATAVLTGFNAAQYGILGVMDADLSHPPELIPKLLQGLKNANLVVGSRKIPGGQVENWPWLRKLSSNFATLLTRPLRIKISDPMSGYFFIKKDVLAGKQFSPIGYKILLELIVKCNIKNIHEVPYVFHNRSVGKSKMGFKESFNYLRHLSRLYYWKFFKQ